ncbi:MAG: N-acetyltransferase [Deltaproteobacteria bacterium]|nr:N-acetyltransferase [Deltaproteobacteria bacterium]
MVRKAVLKDAKEIYELIEFFAKKGALLHRTVGEVYSSLRDFFVYEEDGNIMGVCALHLCLEEMGEIRSLAVKEEASGKGIGTLLVSACLDEARGMGLKRVFALTYRPAFFEKMGFKSIDKEILPHKIWSECVRCIKFPTCDENAMIIEL